VSDSLPLVGLMLGDCTGIGPEQSAKILASRGMADTARLLVIGDRRVLELGARDAGVKLDVRVVKRPEDADWNSTAVQMIDLANIDPASIKRGAISPESGRITGETLKFMIDLALEGRLDGIVFAPLNKAALHAGGWKYNDEHIMFARLTGHQGFHGEMNVLDDKWMSRVTSHVGLREALDQITPKRIDEALTLAYETMKGAGFANPRIAVAALNPHGGENGLFGREEIDVIAPAVVRGAGRGILCKGPFPADTVFIKGFGDEFDGVLTMYHDQGQIATKLKGFNRGVTVSGGLKTVFTTPAHGTAFDIVGKGVASTGAFENAIRLGARLAAARKAKVAAAGSYANANL
jgi:4-hydroxythreonine-4-phosphate dehydrogenase